MKVVLFLVALAVFGGLAAQSSYAQYHPPTTKPAVKHAPASPARPGSVGGPANKFGGINGTGKQTKH